MSGSDGGLRPIAARVEQEDYGFGSMSLRELRGLEVEEMRERPGECVCPVFEDGARGFRQRCPVHGGRSRDDFRRLTALRCEVASRLRAPESSRHWGRS